MGRFSIRVSSAAARRGDGVRGWIRAFLRRHGLVEDETARVTRLMWFALALVPAGGLLMVWGYHISNPYLMMAGLVTVFLAECLCVALTVVVVWRIARIIIGGYRAGRLQWLSKDKSRTQ